jgi:hypothetical protein
MSIARIHLPGKLSKNIDGNIYLKVDKELLQSYYAEILLGEPEVEVEVSILRVDSKRTLPQLAYFYGVVLPIIKERFEELEGTTFTKDEVMSILKTMYLFEEVLFEGEFKKIPMSLAKAKKSEVLKFIQDVIEFGRNILDVEIPEPTKEVKYDRTDS